jgi:hypothetical protein
VAQRDEVSSRVVGVVVQPAGQRLWPSGVLRGTDAAVVRERFVSLRGTGVRNRADRIVERPGRRIERATGVEEGIDNATEIGSGSRFTRGFGRRPRRAAQPAALAPRRPAPCSRLEPRTSCAVVDIPRHVVSGRLD